MCLDADKVRRVRTWRTGVPFPSFAGNDIRKGTPVSRQTLTTVFSVLLCAVLAPAGCSGSTAGDGAETEDAPSAPGTVADPYVELDVGKIELSGGGTCTIIGTRLPAKGALGGFLSATAYHCFEKTFACNKDVITWASGGTSICTEAIVGKGRGEGDFALLRIDKGPEKVTRYAFPQGLGVGDPLALLGPTGAFYTGCTVKARESSPSRVVHDCAQGQSPGLSGAPLLRVEESAKKLIGIHVNHSADKLEATLWPVDFLKQYLAGNAPGASAARAADSQYKDCQTTFFKYLQSKGVSGTPYSDGFLQGATAYLKRTPGAFKDYLKTDFVPFHLGISIGGLPGVCETLAAGDPLGAGLIDAADACEDGTPDESCWMNCCDGTNVRANIATLNKVGCAIYFKGKPEETCKAPPGKP